jgi:single-stranded-DNA-specific exonuclease
MAAGLKLPSSNLAAFTEAFVEQCNRRLPREMLAGRVEYDCDARLEELTAESVTWLEKLGPFGRDNPQVRLRLTGLHVSGRPELMGESGAHLRLRVTQGDSTRQMKLVAWNWGELVRKVPPGASIDAVITPKISTWTGTPIVEGEISDLRIVGA